MKQISVGKSQKNTQMEFYIKVAILEILYYTAVNFLINIEGYSEYSEFYKLVKGTKKVHARLYKK